MNVGKWVYTSSTNCHKPDDCFLIVHRVPDPQPHGTKITDTLKHEATKQRDTEARPCLDGDCAGGGGQREVGLHG
jgi:hypothetical protein